jgi:lauroyl/myristoyl acyltransferase
MNPIPNHQDEQHLYSVVTLLEDNNADALQALGDHLDANKVVVVAADDGFGAHHEIPFLGGTLRLGLGAPTLAAGRSAPLIPLFCGSDGKHGYEVTAEGPLPAALEQESPRAAQLMAEQFAEILIRYLKHQPRMWDGWFARNTWTSNL